MAAPPSPGPQVIRFGVYEADLRAGELRKQGLRIRLPDQPFQVLAILLEQPGDVVTREELQKRLWPDGTFVDFEQGLNAAVKRLREALGDSPENPRFIETLARRGYRFIAPVDGLVPVSAKPRVLKLERIGIVGALAVLAALVALNVGGWRERIFGGSRKPIRSVAVLPLANLSGDPEQDYFADGMTEALITELGKISALRVISRQSMMQYKGTKKSAPQIARELNVEAIVEGTVLRAGDRVRISVQLIEAAPERHLWADSYDRELRGILALQNEVARGIANEIRVKLTPEEQALLASARPVSPEAFELYLKGRFHWNQRTDQDVKKSIEYFQKATEEDPTYALAYAALSQAYHVGAYRLLLPGAEGFVKAEAAARKALELDDTLGEAHAALAAVRSENFDWEGTVRELRRAIELDPNSVTARSWYAEILSQLGRHEEALREIHLAWELDPLSNVVNRKTGNLLYLARRYDEAIAQYRETLGLYPYDPITYYGLWHSYIEKGMYDEAVAAFLKGIELEKATQEEQAAYRKAYRERGIQGVWRHRAEALKRKGLRPWAVACCYARLGEKDKAFKSLDKVFELGAGTGDFPVEPCLDNLRPDPRFQDLMRRMNFPAVS